jgi:hypothetical protein
MTREEVLAALGGDDEPKMARVTYGAGLTMNVLIDCVDSEGILHSGQDGVEPRGWWSRCIDIEKIELL